MKVYGQRDSDSPKVSEPKTIDLSPLFLQIEHVFKAKFDQIDSILATSFKKLNELDLKLESNNKNYESRLEQLIVQYAELNSTIRSIASEKKEANSKLNREINDKLEENIKKIEDMNSVFRDIKSQFNELNISTSEQIDIMQRIVKNQPFKYYNTRLGKHYDVNIKETIEDCWKYCLEDEKCLAISFNNEAKKIDSNGKIMVNFNCYKYKSDFGNLNNLRGWTSYSLKNFK